MLALQQASLRLNVVWISCPSYILSSFLGAKIGFIFDTSKEKGRKVHLWGFFCLFVRHLNRLVRQKTANELDTLDLLGYTLPITLFLILYVLTLHCNSIKEGLRLRCCLTYWHNEIQETEIVSRIIYWLFGFFFIIWFREMKVGFLGSSLRLGLMNNVRLGGQRTAKACPVVMIRQFQEYTLLII